MIVFNFKKIIISFVITICFFPMVSLAQQLLPENITIKINPSLPKANESILLEIESYVVNLDTVYIRWFKNNELLVGDLGQKKFSFVAGNIGDVDVITVEVIVSEDNFTTKTISITPAEVDLIWEADSLTPPFYRGKALNSFQSDVKIIAIPNMVDSGGSISSEELIYKWEKDWVVLGSLSGYGKDTLDLKNIILPKDFIISVEAKTVDGKIKAKKSVIVSNHEPKVLIYKKDSLLGTLFNTAISGQFNLHEEEVALVAYPFFFSKNDFSVGNLTYNWTMNSKSIDNENNNLLVLRQEGDGEGSSRLGLEIKNVNKIMQSVRERFDIIFGSKEGSLFGN